MSADPSRSSLESLLLAAVADEPGHGYALIERLRERSGGAFDLAEGTAYPILHRLEQAGLLASSWVHASGRRRRVYRLTRRGRRALDERRRDWRAYSRAVDLVLEGSR
jgi:PadR family transcriptional regulator, regulatory protein PadR